MTLSRLLPGTLRASLFALALAAAASAGAAAQERPTLEAAPLYTLPRLDGDILGDAAWQKAPVGGGFVQTRPDAGRPASERTEIRIGYTADTLWVGVVLYDDSPDSIIVSDSRRDASLDDTDAIQFIIDSFRDGQNGYVFGTNPAGIEYDGQLVNEATGATFGGLGGPPPGGGGGRFRRGSGGGFNLNWDGKWEVRTEIGPYGWSAEFAIPFATLRYPASSEPQTWGINFQRNIRDRAEIAYWAPLERQFGLYRLVDAGTVTGIEAPKVRNLKLTPYVKATFRRPPDGPDDIDDDFDGGLDVKYGLTPSLTLDLTVNTDFAEVEVDEQQINLDRFNLFVPEKRPFFLENAGLFSVGATA
ncbi:MAG: DUF5916 domain-containing protein, partial [Thermoanaerobaculia bacterium]|nr:DUF5916 domain-containing protein [Thermoanaerobaculia bacterium]